MDILVEIDDEDLLQLLLMAKRHRRSLNEEMLDILERAARPDPFRPRKTQTIEARSKMSNRLYNLLFETRKGYESDAH